VRIRQLIAVVALPCGLAAQGHQPPLNVLPASGTTQLSTSFEAATVRPRHIWRDTPPFNDDGTITAYIEISRGSAKVGVQYAHAIDRMIPRISAAIPSTTGLCRRRCPTMAIRSTRWYSGLHGWGSIAKRTPIDDDARLLPRAHRVRSRSDRARVPPWAASARRFLSQSGDHCVRENYSRSAFWQRWRGNNGTAHRGTVCLRPTERARGTRHPGCVNLNTEAAAPWVRSSARSAQSR
jgi:hypothetical protein